MSPRSNDQPVIIEDPQLIRLLASSVRQDIIDFVDSAGASSVAEIAAAIGRPADTLYYHLRLLLAAGLLVRRDAEDAGGMIVDVPGHPVALRYRPDDPAASRALRSVAGALLRSAERHFGSALAREGVEIEVEGPERNLWISRVRGRLTDSELRKVNEGIQRLHAIFRRGRNRRASARSRMHEISVVLCPLREERVDRRRP